ncbi:MAG: HAMP domain-containing histidine kinase, partial [Flavobacterium sp.]
MADGVYSQMYVAVWGLFLAFVYLSGVSVTHKMMYIDLCTKVQVNYERSEDLTKEVVKVIHAKDQFVSSISNEVKNVLGSLNESVEYLLKVLKDSAYIQVLRNVKLSGEILLNLVNNALDATRIRADSFELEYDIADFESIVRKALIIHTESLKRKNIFAQAVIDTNLPQKLLIDSARLFQVMVNLVSNAIKSTPNDGQIYIEVSWYGGQQDAETFLRLIKSKDFRGLKSPSMSETRIIGGDIISSRSEEDYMSSGRKRSASSRNILEFSFEEESRRQKNLIALGITSMIQKISSSTSRKTCHLFQNSEHYVMKRQKLSNSQRTC